MNEERDQMILDFSVPVVNKNLTIVEADPFEIMIKKENMTCKMEYTGPEVAVMSDTEDCVYNTYRNTGYTHRLPLTTSLKCNNRTSLEKENYFKINNCKMSRLNEEKDFVQIKIYDNKYFIYCPGSSYEIGRRTVKCPLKVFTLPLTATFTLNEIEYQGSVLNIVYQQREDPLFIEKLNWHLTPGLNWFNLTAGFEEDWRINEQKIKQDMKTLTVFHFQDQDQWTFMQIIVVVMSLVIIGFLVLCIIKLVKGKNCKQGGKRVEDKPEESQHEEIPMNVVHHHHINEIIVNDE